MNWGPKAAPLPANKFDFVLAARVFHGWMNGNSQDANLAKIFASLKPGGVLAVEQHRGNPGAEPVKQGYVTEQAVIDAATKAGFKFDGKSEINANPEGHQGSSVRRVDAAAGAPVIGRRQARGSGVRSRQVRRHRRVGSHDPALREAQEVSPED